MKTLISFILALSVVTVTQAQSVKEKELVTEACMNYLDGFYQGDTTKIINSIRPTLNKFGFWKNKSGKYAPAGHMTFDQAKNYSKSVFEKKQFAKEDAPKTVEVLDIMNHIACAKITAFWGVDFVLLSKEGDKWMIEQVIWEGPLEK